MSNTNNKAGYFKIILPLIGLFIAVSCITFITKNQLTQLKIDPIVLQTANLLICILCCINIKLHSVANENKNPNVSVTMVLLSTIIKFFAIATAVFGYLLLAKERSVFAIFCGMFLYFIYAFIEVRIALKIKK